LEKNDYFASNINIQKCNISSSGKLHCKMYYWGFLMCYFWFTLECFYPNKWNWQFLFSEILKVHGSFFIVFSFYGCKHSKLKIFEIVCLHHLSMVSGTPTWIFLNFFICIISLFGFKYWKIETFLVFCEYSFFVVVSTQNSRAWTIVGKEHD
jgi:hypothetical protein